jgi:hypothetical protein
MVATRTDRFASAGGRYGYPSLSDLKTRAGPKSVNRMTLERIAAWLNATDASERAA